MAVTWRYNTLRSTVAALAAPAEEQSAILNAMFEEMDGENAKYRPNDELYEEFYDILLAGGTMVSEGELTEDQLAAVTKIEDDFPDTEPGDGFWERSALFNDKRWEDVRKVAAKALEALPPLP